MDVAVRFSELSHGRRLKVGCIIVKDNRIISIGYNGMPEGFPNDCEDEIIKDGEVELVTKPEVLHAEMNALMKLAKSAESGDRATMFVTHAPCIDCAKLIHQSGITEVYYRHPYRTNEGIEFLSKCRIRQGRV